MKKLSGKGRSMDATTAKRMEFLNEARDAPQAIKRLAHGQQTAGEKGYFTYYLPRDLGQRVRLEAVHQGKRPAGIIEDALREYLDKRTTE